MARHRFADFTLDIDNRVLLQAGRAIALNSRYFDALALLVREQGRLVAKQRFFDEVWAGSVVTDAALTQCIKEIRRLLGDDAGDPRFVHTVAGHGYRFIAVVQLEAEAAADPPAVDADRPAATRVADAAGGRAPAGLPDWVVDGAAAALGGATAGLAGGLLYGSLLAYAPPAQSLGSLSVLLVLLALCVLVGFAGAFGVGLGLSAGRRFGIGAVGIALGAAVGGMLVGGATRLLGSDAFTLLVGRAPTGITGGLEGAAIGLALGSGFLLGGGRSAARGWRPVVGAALATAAAGALIAISGGSMMAHSLASVAAAFDQSRLDMAPLGRLVGEPRFGEIARTVLASLEGALFGACVAAALLLARRHRTSDAGDG